MKTRPFGNTGMFGDTFVMFLPLVWMLRKERGTWQRGAWLLAGLMILGALSSMSSGPWMMLAVVLFLLALEGHKHWLKPLFVGGGLLILLAGVASNRSFYHVVFSYANPLGGTGWHRGRLIDAAVKTFGEWCLLGYGGRDPGWGQYTGMTWTDITNQYLLVAAQSGLGGLVAFCIMLLVAVSGLLTALKRTDNAWMASAIWAMFCVQGGLVVVFVSVSLSGQPVSLFYGFLAITASLTVWVRRTSIQVSPGYGGRPESARSPRRQSLRLRRSLHGH